MLVDLSLGDKMLLRDGVTESPILLFAFKRLLAWALRLFLFRIAVPPALTATRFSNSVLFIPQALVATRDPFLCIDG